MSSASAPENQYKILVVDDHPLIRQGLALLIHHEDDLCLCGEAATAAEVLQAVETAPPDLVVVDLMLEEGSGLDLIRTLHHRLPGLPILVISMNDEQLYAERVLRLGARGYVMKRELTHQVLNAIRQVLSGGLAFSENILVTLGEHSPQASPGGKPANFARLSDRELEITEYLRQGYSRRQTAAALNIEVSAIDAYCTTILRKLHLEDVTELVRYPLNPAFPEPGGTDQTPAASRFRFEAYLLDTARRELWHQGKVVPLEPKVYQVLVYLVQHADRIVTREELLDNIWSGIHVQDAVVSRCIREVRAALGDTHTRQQMILTRPRQGYRFVAPITEVHD
ncbi:MAG: hypothetical protein ETSY1_21040 [Candidatus Entotheonella factor]|uniref:Uncharacterized protein n=1 Tax=Entotheonella factor TaxID=1429438 RepID=W4LKM8_ENTF1|nr:MAG: hypothetical protein ETSY1_21040 [Candidatus Entotheonella factor]